MLAEPAAAMAWLPAIACCLCYTVRRCPTGTLPKQATACRPGERDLRLPACVNGPPHFSHCVFFVCLQAGGQPPDHARHLRVLRQLHRGPGGWLLFVHWIETFLLPFACVLGLPARCFCVAGGGPAPACRAADPATSCSTPAPPRRHIHPHPPPHCALPLLPAQVRDAEAKGATLCTGPFKREGNLIWPVVVDNVTPDMRLAWEEVGGLGGPGGEALLS